MALTKVKLIADGVITSANLDASHGITTSDIGEGSNLYYTDSRVSSYLSTNGFATQTDIVAAITDSAPVTLDTLNELAAALGDDPNFATTTATSLGLKAPLASPSFTGNATFAGRVAISHSSGDTLTLTKTTTEPSLRIEGDTNKDFVMTVSGELLTFTQNDGATDILTLDHDTKNATFTGTVTVGTGTVAAANAAADDFVITGPGTTATGMTISNSSDAGTGTIFFGDTTSSSVAGFRYNHNTGDMAISAEDNIIFTCDNVGIGGSPSTFANFTNVTIQGGSSGSNLDFKNSSGTRVSAIVTTASNELIIETGTAQPMIFKTNDTERMRIDSSGDLYVGGTTNYGKVTIEQGGDVSGLVVNNTTAHPPRLYLRDAGSATYSEILANNDLVFNASQFKFNSSNALGFYFNTTSASYGAYAVFQSQGSTKGELGYNAGAMYFGGFTGVNTILMAGASNIMYLNTNGRVGIGVTSPNAKLHVDGTFFATCGFSPSYTTDGLYNSNASPSKIITPSGQEILFGYFDNGAGGYFPRIGFKQDYDAVGSPYTTTAKTSLGLEIDGRMSFKVGASNSIEALSISSGGYIKALPTYSLTTATAANMHIDSNGTFYRSTSSLKYKKDVTDYDKGLNEVMQLKPKYYKGKTNGNKQFAGLIAEDVHDLGLTEFVQYADDGSPDALSYTHMIALLTRSIQELKADNDNLRERIQTLENQ